MFQWFIWSCFFSCFRRFCSQLAAFVWKGPQIIDIEFFHSPLTQRDEFFDPLANEWCNYFLIFIDTYVAAMQHKTVYPDFVSIRFLEENLMTYRQKPLSSWIQYLSVIIHSKTKMWICGYSINYFMLIWWFLSDLVQLLRLQTSNLSHIQNCTYT